MPYPVAAARQKNFGNAPFDPILINAAFTAADGTSLHLYTIAPKNVPNTSFTEQAGDFSITGGKVVVAASASSNLTTLNAGIYNGIFRLKVKNNSTNVGVNNYAGIIIRYTDINNYWLVGIHQTDDTFAIIEKLAGTNYSRASASVAISSSVEYSIEVTVANRTITATLNGANSISYASAANNEFSTLHGIKLRTTTDAADDFIIETTATQVVSEFAVVADPQYADKDPSGDRYYRDSDNKFTDFVAACNADSLIKFIGMLGDYQDATNNVTPANAVAWIGVMEAILGNSSLPKFAAWGNHDFEDTTLADLDTYTVFTNPQGYGSADVGDVHVIWLDACYSTEAGDGTHYTPGDGHLWADVYVPETEQTWLAADLAATTKNIIVVLIHHLLEEYAQDGYWIVNRTDVRTILESVNKIIHVFEGHQHGNAHTQIKGVMYHRIAGMVVNPYPANNAYTIVKIYNDGSFVLDGRGLCNDWP